MQINKISVSPLDCHKLLTDDVTYNPSLVIRLPDNTEIKIPKQGGQFPLSKPLISSEINKLDITLYMSDRQPGIWTPFITLYFPDKYTNNVIHTDELTTLMIEFRQGLYRIFLSPTVK